jgi:hypothetical protein
MELMMGRLQVHSICNAECLGLLLQQLVVHKLSFRLLPPALPLEKTSISLDGISPAATSEMVINFKENIRCQHYATCQHLRSPWGDDVTGHAGNLQSSLQGIKLSDPPTL